MFPDAPQSEHDELVEITWDEFFEEFEKRELALLYARRACSTRSSAETPPSDASGASPARRATRRARRRGGRLSRA
jgi:hypothetical protein